MATDDSKTAVAPIDAKLLKGLKLTGFEDPITRNLKVADHLFKTSGMVSLAPLLPVLLNLKGEPYTLKDHFPFEPFFRTRVPRSTVLKTSRQVSKSTSLAARGIVMANCMPHFSTLYIAPLFEQIRRFSQNYVRPFIETSPVRGLYMGKGTINSVLQRSFHNHSQMLFSFAFVDAERVRGISADKVAVDESVKAGTMVLSNGDSIAIERLKPFDTVLCADGNGNVTTDQVKSVKDHGTRDCYRLSFSDGSWLELTSDAPVATTGGWKRVETVIREAHAEIVDRTAATTLAGDDAGRRQHDFESSAALSVTARLVSAPVQLSEVHGIVRVRTHDTQQGEERRLRRMVESVGDTELRGTLPYRFFVSPQRQEVRQPSVARSADLGGRGLVVHGRRDVDRGETGTLQHPRLQPTGSRATGFMADEPRCAGQSEEDQQQAETGKTVLCCAAERRDNLQVRGADSPVRIPGNGIQDRATGTHRGAGVLVLRPDLSVTRQHASVRGADPEVMLPIACVPEEASPAEQREADEQARKTPGQKSTGSPSLLQRLGRQSPAVEGDGCRLSPTTPGSGEGVQAKADPQAAGSQAESNMDLSPLRGISATREYGHSDPLLCDVSGSGDRGAEASLRVEEEGLACEQVELVGVSWVGQHRVFDIETFKHHNFFAGNVLISNCQNMDKDLLPIIMETMSASRYGVREFAGTPLSLENTLEGLWQDSSQAEWVIKCSRCGYHNIAAMAYDLDDMTGPLRDDISDDKPACVCAKCRKPVNPRTGFWVHGRPDKRWDCAGYHVPQQIMPMHYGSYDKWSLLLGKRAGKGNTQTHQFYNEVCGESYDTGSRLVTLTDLKAAANLGWPNKLDIARQRLESYTLRVLAVDWGGGGQEGVSFTTLTVLGMLPDGRIHCLWGYRSLTPHDHIREARLCLMAMGKFQCHVLAHDYTGAGSLRETFIRHAGVPVDRIIPIQYVRAASGNIMTYKPASEQHPRDVWMVDKSRSLLLTCNHVKLGWLRFFDYDYNGADDSGLLHDFLALVEEKADSRMGRDIYTIIRDPNMIDDFAQACNIGCCTLWHMSNNWPNLADMTKYTIDDDLLQAIHPLGAVEWEDI